jgi:hypothetical protein
VKFRGYGAIVKHVDVLPHLTVLVTLFFADAFRLALCVRQCSSLEKEEKWKFSFFFSSSSVDCTMSSLFCNLLNFCLQLVEAFHATLEEVVEADMLVVSFVTFFCHLPIPGSLRVEHES